MNLYKFHNAPESLEGHDLVSEKNPHIFWDKYKSNKEELKKREKYIAQETEYAYFAYHYAADVLEGPFPKGEAAIAKDAGYSYYYARDILKADFYLDGKLIAKAE